MMRFHRESARVFVPDGTPAPEALARTTHMGISAHHDDLEIMAIDGILRSFRRPDRWFTGVVVTDGSGSPRAGRYAETTDEEMQANMDLVRTMSVRPPMGTGHVRLIDVAGVDLQPCGGTHVARTGEIGRVQLGKIENKGKHNRRVNVLFAPD